MGQSHVIRAQTKGQGGQYSLHKWKYHCTAYLSGLDAAALLFTNYLQIYLLAWLVESNPIKQISRTKTLHCTYKVREIIAAR